MNGWMDRLALWSVGYTNLSRDDDMLREKEKNGAEKHPYSILFLPHTKQKIM